MAIQQQKPLKTNTETLEITNFGGPLTRINNGKIDSGKAKFVSSFGYDPFSKPGQLTWFEQPVDITGSSITDLVLSAKTRGEGTPSQQYVYAVGNHGNLYKITPNSSTNANVDTPSLIGTVGNSSDWNFGASMDFFGSTEKIYIGNDAAVYSVNFDGSGSAVVGTSGDYNANVYRPVQKFIGYLAFGNKTNIGLIDSTNTVISSVVSGKYNQLSPSLPPETYITDLDVSPDGNYLLLTASGISNEQIGTISGDRQSAASSEGNIFKWNGVDLAITAQTKVPSYAVTAMQTYLDNNLFFSNDSFGSAVNSGSNKILTLPNNKSPFTNSTLVNGNFLSWISPEVDSGTIKASLYYYGNLDSENQKGLYRLLRYNSTLTNGFVYNVPTNILTNNKFSTINGSASSIVTMGYGKHYFSTYEVNSTASIFGLKRFLVTSSGSGTPQAGVYETQNQLFSKRISLSEIRVYCEPTVSGNGFQLDIIGSNGSPVTNGTFSYTYSAGTDITLLQGALERINFNPNFLNIYSIGVRITNTGSTNMTINKVEVDWQYAGK